MTTGKVWVPSPSLGTLNSMMGDMDDRKARKSGCFSLKIGRRYNLLGLQVKWNNIKLQTHDAKF